MSYQVTLEICQDTYQRFQQIHQKMNQGTSENLSKPLGEVLADLSCEIVDQVFGEVSRHSAQHSGDSDKVIQQITDAVRKYMPWSVSFFGNDRLLPMVNYLQDMTQEKAEKYWVCYAVDNVIVKETMGCLERIREGNNAYIPAAFKAFTQIVDQGVSSLVREPKKMLKFNFVVDKTLNGVISFTTQLGYKRLEKMGSQLDAETTMTYFKHLLSFVEDPQQKNSFI